MNSLQFRRAAILLLLLAPIALRAQEPETSEVKQEPTPAKPKAPVRGSVAGHVVFGDTHAPARGARVLLLPARMLDSKTQQEDNNQGQPPVAITGLDGSFMVQHVAAGQYYVTTFAAGYLSPLDGIFSSRENGKDDEKAMEEELRARAPTVNVAAEATARIDIELERGAVLAGRVLYSDGAPAGQMRIKLEPADEPKTPKKAGEGFDVGAVLRMLVLQQTPSTDDEGHFRLAGINPGRYVIAVPQPLPLASFQEEMFTAFDPDAGKGAGLTVFSGDTLHRKAAKVYELKAGDKIDGIEITLPLTGLHNVEGTVTGKDGALLSYAWLDLTDTSDRSVTYHTTVHAAGEFRFSAVPEGTYELKCSNGRIFTDQPPNEIAIDNMQFVDQQFKPSRAFAESTQDVIVGTTDIENLTVTPPDTKLPDPPKMPPNVESIPAPAPQ